MPNAHDAHKAHTSDTTLFRPRKVAAVTFAGFTLLGAVAGCSSQSNVPAADASTSSDAATATSSATASSGATPSSTAPTSGYTDGTYSADGSYASPGGQESISVSITLASGVVTAVEVTPEASSGNALQYQKQFASGISSEVVGKDIDDISVSRVSGSSLTSAGFNAALDEIKSEASA